MKKRSAARSHDNAMRMSRNAVQTMLTTRSSLTKRGEIEIVSQRDKTKKRRIEVIRKMQASSITKAMVTFRSEYPYVFDALFLLCTRDPEVRGKKVIQGRDDDASVYWARLDWKILKYLALAKFNNQLRQFEIRIFEALRRPPRNMLLVTGGGHYAIAEPFHIRRIVLKNNEDLTSAEAARLITLNSTGLADPGRPRGIIRYVEIEFSKDLFKDCFEENEKGGNGFIPADPQLYAKIVDTVSKAPETPEWQEAACFMISGNTEAEIRARTPGIWYRFVLYFLQHFSGNPKAETRRFSAQDTIVMLRELNPHMLRTQNGKDSIRSWFNARLFLDQGFFYFNAMGRTGNAEEVRAVPESARYSKEPGFFEVTFCTRHPRKKYLGKWQSNLLLSPVLPAV